MVSRSRYAFVPTPGFPATANFLDFSECRRLVGRNLPAGRLAKMYDDWELPLSREQFGQKFAELNDSDRAVVAWIYGGAVLEDALRLGICVAYILDPNSGAPLIVPTRYWAQAGLEFPTNSQILLLDPVFAHAARFDGSAMFLVEREILQALGGQQTARRGRKPKYDWLAFRERLTHLLEDNGLPIAGDADWTSQADIERKMLSWCRDTWNYEPSLTQVRGHVRSCIVALTPLTEAAKGP